MSEPVTLFEAKTHLRLEATGSLPVGYDDEYITGLITAGREWCENYLGRSLIPKTLDLLLDDFPHCDIPLPYGPVTSITSIKYIDYNGTEQTLASNQYVLYFVNEKALIRPAYSITYPSVRAERNAVRIKYLTGYATPALIPEAIKQAIKLYIGDLYENRLGQMDRPLVDNNAIESLLAPYNFWGGL
jgi:uncharacterized phiE125 gp8 family phage protein